MCFLGAQKFCMVLNAKTTIAPGGVIQSSLMRKKRLVHPQSASKLLFYLFFIKGLTYKFKIDLRKYLISFIPLYFNWGHF